VPAVQRSATAPELSPRTLLVPSPNARPLPPLQPPGASLAALGLLPRRAPLAGCAVNGALFGLFAMATLFNPAKSWHWHRWFELGTLFPFVALQLATSQAALAPWWTVQGLKAGAWVPLLGGLAGAAVAASLLKLGRILAAGIQQQRQQAAAAAASSGGGGGDTGGAAPPPEPVAALLGKAATLLLRRLV
jgi:hypothetical protein